MNAWARGAVGAVAVLVALVFAYFVWPTPYRPVLLPDDLLNRADHLCCYAARVNRFTSAIQVLDLNGWKTLALQTDSTTAQYTAVILWHHPKPP